MIDWDRETPSQVAERAARRAIEAISRVGTLNTDLMELSERLGTIEAQIGDILALAEMLIQKTTGEEA